MVDGLTKLLFRTGSALGLINLSFIDEDASDVVRLNVEALDTAKFVNEYFVSRRCARTLDDTDRRVDIIGTLGT